MSNSNQKTKLLQNKILYFLKHYLTLSEKIIWKKKVQLSIKNTANENNRKYNSVI